VVSVWTNLGFPSSGTWETWNIARCLLLCIESYGLCRQPCVHPYQYFHHNGRLWDPFNWMSAQHPIFQQQIGVIGFLLMSCRCWSMYAVRTWLCGFQIEMLGLLCVVEVSDRVNWLDISLFSPGGPLAREVGICVSPPLIFFSCPHSAS